MDTDGCHNQSGTRSHHRFATTTKIHPPTIPSCVNNNKRSRNYLKYLTQQYLKLLFTGKLRGYKTQNKPLPKHSLTSKFRGCKIILQTQQFPRVQQPSPTHTNTPAPKTCLRRSNQNLPTKNNKKKTIHMGNFIWEIYLKEKYGHDHNVPNTLCNAIIDPHSGKSLEFSHLI